VVVVELAHAREPGLLEHPAARRPVERGVGGHALDLGQLARPRDQRTHRVGRVAAAAARGHDRVADLDEPGRDEAAADLADHDVVLDAVQEVRAEGEPLPTRRPTAAENSVGWSGATRTSSGGRPAPSASPAAGLIERRTMLMAGMLAPRRDTSPRVVLAARP
jgi:hypothetical protein